MNEPVDGRPNDTSLSDMNHQTLAKNSFGQK
jgi:hypothetical protein